MRTQISKYKQIEEVVSSIYCLQILCMYRVAAKIKSLMTTEYGLKVINRKLRGGKKYTRHQWASQDIQPH